MQGKAVVTMRWMERALFCLGVVLLLTLAGPALVQGPEEDVQAADAAACVPSAMPALMQAAAASEGTVLPVSARQAEERAAMPHTERDAGETACSVVSDGNGWPVTAGTWTRAVYAACPPEGMPG